MVSYTCASSDITHILYRQFAASSVFQVHVPCIVLFLAWEKARGIAARGIVAAVQQIHPVRDRSYQAFPCEPVSPDNLAITETKSTIALLRAAGPRPAGIWPARPVYLLPESFFGRSGINGLGSVAASLRARLAGRIVPRGSLDRRAVIPRKRYSVFAGTTIRAISRLFGRICTKFRDVFREMAARAMFLHDRLQSQCPGWGWVRQPTWK